MGRDSNLTSCVGLQETFTKAQPGPGLWGAKVGGAKTHNDRGQERAAGQGTGVRVGAHIVL